MAKFMYHERPCSVVGPIYGQGLGVRRRPYETPVAPSAPFKSKTIVSHTGAKTGGWGEVIPTSNHAAP